MNIFPRRTEIIVSALRPEEIADTIKKAVEPTPETGLYHRFSDRYFFTGSVLPSEFRLIPSNEGSDYFMPRITGRIEGSGNGSILLLYFTMAKLTRIMLFFFVVLSFLILVFFLFYQQKVYIGITAFLAGVFNYILAIRNFNANSKRIKGKILWILNIRKKLLS